MITLTWNTVGFGKTQMAIFRLCFQCNMDILSYSHFKAVVMNFNLIQRTKQKVKYSLRGNLDTITQPDLTADYFTFLNM